MRAAIAGSLAAISGASAIATCSSRWRPKLPEPLTRRRPRVRTGLAVVGSWPLVRGARLSGRTADLLPRSGIARTEREIVSLKLILAATAGPVVLATAGPLLGLLFGLVAFRAPDIAIARAARRRLLAADREIPVLFDLLAVATSAGLPPQLAFRRAVEAAEGPLADELRSVLNATDLGGRWRDELRTVSERLQLPDLRRLVGTLARSDVLGSPVSDEIARLASDVRERRRARATERARAAPVKMLFPLVFLVLPAFLLLTVVPVLVTTVRSIV